MNFDKLVRTGDLAKTKLAHLPADAPAALTKALVLSNDALERFEIAKKGGNPSEIAQRRCDLELAKVALLRERKVAFVLAQIACAPKFRYGA